MYSKLIHNSLLLAIILISTALNVSAQTKSYRLTQMVTFAPQGPMINVPDHNMGDCITWSDNKKKITMFDGKTWQYTNSSDGYHHYKYVGSVGNFPPSPAFQYIETIFNNNYTNMHVIYNFNAMGLILQTREDYLYMGEGKEPFFNWCSMNNQSNSSYNNVLEPIEAEWHNCIVCNGNGFCKYCGGSGADEYARNGRCGVCRGTGKCAGCEGKGGYKM